MKKNLNLLAWPFMLSPLAYLYYKWPSIPEKVAVHFGLDGTADRFGSKTEFLTMILVLTGINLAIFLGLPKIYKVDPSKSAADNKGRLKGITLAVVIFMTFISFLIVENAGKESLIFETKWIISALGIFWAVLGNYMYNIKPNYFAGIRLPWTLSDAENWTLTHRLAGKLWFAGGLIMVVAAFLVPASIVPIVFISIAAITTIIPIVYSYQLYAKKKASQA